MELWQLWNEPLRPNREQTSPVVLLLLLLPPGSHLGSEELVQAVLLPPFAGGGTKHSSQSQSSRNAEALKPECVYLFLGRSWDGGL